MTMQAHELEAFLGDDHGLDDEQFAELLRISDEIGERHPDADDETERTAALMAAYRVLRGEPVVSDLADDLMRARTAEMAAFAGLRQVALMTIPERWSEQGFSHGAGVDRMTVRKWLGKR